MTRNEEITLSDGSPAYRSEVTWLYIPAAVSLETQIVSAYRGGRLVSITAHPRQSMEHISKLVESLPVPVGAALVAAPCPKSSKTWNGRRQASPLATSHTRSKCRVQNGCV